MEHFFKGWAIVMVISIVAILFTVTLIFCGNKNAATQMVEGFTIITIDQCEYIESHTYMGGNVYSHKGNCNNPIHIYNLTK